MHTDETDGAPFTEIERKFLVAQVPSDDMLGVGVHLRQGYLAEEGAVEVRLRVAGDVATLTVKAGRGRTRTEVESPLTLAAAEALWPHTEGRRIDKHRHRVQVGAYTVDVDRYRGALAGLCVAEVEFSSATEADAFTPPSWFGREVTGEGDWSNAALARSGRPDRTR